MLFACYKNLQLDYFKKLQIQNYFLKLLMSKDTKHMTNNKNET